MKDPASVFGCWRGFSFRFRGSTQTDLQTLKRISIFSRARAARSSDRAARLRRHNRRQTGERLSGVRICFGLDGFVRSHAIISIDQVGPIGRHGVLPPPPRQRMGERNWRKGGHAGTEWNQCTCERKLLRSKAIVEVQEFNRLDNQWICAHLEGRALPPARETRRSVYSKKAVGSCFGIRGPNSKARARVFRCIPRCADWPAMIGRLNGRRSGCSQSFTHQNWLAGLHNCA
jgi:hypothetical protein